MRQSRSPAWPRPGTCRCPRSRRWWTSTPRAGRSASSASRRSTSSGGPSPSTSCRRSPAAKAARMESATPVPRPDPPRPGPGGAGILIVEDEPELVRALRINLRARQYDVRTAGTGREALAVAARHPPDAIILRLGLPDIDGTEVIVALREWYHAPIIVLSGRTSPGDKIGALDVGADDYVTKPFAMAELLARLRAVLRRDDAESGTGRVRQATIGRWLVDVAAHQVRRAASDDARDTLRLTPTEWRLPGGLLRPPGPLVGAAQLLAAGWGPGVGPRTQQLPVHLAG